MSGIKDKIESNIVWIFLASIILVTGFVITVMDRFFTTPKNEEIVSLKEKLVESNQQIQKLTQEIEQIKSQSNSASKVEHSNVPTNSSRTGLNSSPLNSTEEKQMKPEESSSNFLQINDSDEFPITTGYTKRYYFEGKENQPVGIVITVSYSGVYFDKVIEDSLGQPMKNSIAVKRSGNTSSLTFTPPKTGKYTLTFVGKRNSGTIKVGIMNPDNFASR